jgi:hypothetical protein
MEWDATFQAAKLRLNPRFAKGRLSGKFYCAFCESGGLKISYSEAAKGLFHAARAQFSEIFFRRKFALKKSRTTFADPNGIPVTERRGNCPMV